MATLSGTLISSERKESPAAGEFYKLEVMGEGNRYATKLTAFSNKGKHKVMMDFLRDAAAGTYVTVTFDEEASSYTSNGRVVPFTQRTVTAIEKGDVNVDTETSTPEPDDYVPEFDDPKPTLSVPLTPPYVDEGTEKDKLIVDQVLTKIAADIYCSRDDESPEACAWEAIAMWNAVRSRHLLPVEEEETL